MKKLLQEYSEFRYCMHACGSINNLAFTNTLEALEYWYAFGIKMFEVDIDYAGQGKYVACHDFIKETFEKMELKEIPERCTYEWFKNQKLYPTTTGGLTPLTLEDIFLLLVKYQDIYVMIDPKIYSYDEVSALLETIMYYINQFAIDGKRIVFETYTEDMVLATRKYRGMIQYQFCVEDERQTLESDKIRKWDSGVLINFLKENEVWVLSYPWKYAVENLEKLKKMKNEGFVIFSRTKNDILTDLIKKAGVNVNIIDYLVTDAQEKELKNYKEKYYEEYQDKIETVFGMKI